MVYAAPQDGNVFSRQAFGYSCLSAMPKHSQCVLLPSFLPAAYYYYYYYSLSPLSLSFSRLLRRRNS